MGKAKTTVAPENQRRSPRVAALKPRAIPVETKKKAAPKKAPKAKKAKPAENGGTTKAEEPKADATEAK